MAAYFDLAETRLKKPRILERIQQDIKKLVVCDALFEASELLFELVCIYDTTKDSEVVVLRAGISRLEKEQRKGTLDFDKICKERNSLASRLLDINGSIFQESYTKIRDSD